MKHATLRLCRFFFTPIFFLFVAPVVSADWPSEVFVTGKVLGFDQRKVKVEIEKGRSIWVERSMVLASEDPRENQWVEIVMTTTPNLSRKAIDKDE